MSFQRRLLLLLLPFLVFLIIFPSFSSAQNSTTTSNIVLTVQATLELCEDADLNWSDNDTAPLYEVYLARGYGAVGDNNSLYPEQWIAAVDNTTLVWPLTSEWANVGDVLRFRVQEQGGNGPGGVAWSSVTGDTCPHGIQTVSRFPEPTTTISVHTTEAVTTKNTETRTINQLPGPRTTVNVVAPGSSGASPGPQYTTLPSIPSPTSPPGSNTDANPPGGVTLTLVISGTFTTFDTTVTAAQPQATPSLLNGQQVPPPSLTAAPNESSSQDTTPQQGVSLSPQAIGAIVATLCIATALWVWFVAWRRRRRRRAAALLPRESMGSGSAGHLLTSSSGALSPSPHGQPMAVASIYPQTQMLTAPASASTLGYAELARVPSYGEATRLYSPLENPDPFRHSFGLRRAPSNSDTMPGMPQDGHHN